MATVGNALILPLRIFTVPSSGEQYWNTDLAVPADRPRTASQGRPRRKARVRPRLHGRGSA